MSNTDVLENEALDARADLASRRSEYPKIAANWLQQSLKSDLKASMTFGVETGYKANALTSRFESSTEILKLDLQRSITSSHEKIFLLENDLRHVSKALDMISKKKSINQLKLDIPTSKSKEAI